jgi:hypothetical protein
LLRCAYMSAEGGGVLRCVCVTTEVFSVLSWWRLRRRQKRQKFLAIYCVLLCLFKGRFSAHPSPLAFAGSHQQIPETRIEGCVH